MKVYRKSDNREITVVPYYIKDQFAGYVETKPNGVRRFYYPQSVIVKEYYGG